MKIPSQKKGKYQKQMKTKEFYRNPHVLKRILEYCGVPAEETANFEVEEGILLKDSAALKAVAERMSVEYVAGFGDGLREATGKGASSRYPHQIGELLDLGVNFFRSLWDKSKLTFLLDVEHFSKVNIDMPYRRQGELLQRFEPAYRCLWDMFAEYGIQPMTLVTGKGYHFVFDVASYESNEFECNGSKGEDNGLKDEGNGLKIATPAAREIEQLGHLDGRLRQKYNEIPAGGKRRRAVEPELGKAFDAVGRLMEFLVHKALSRLPDYGSDLPGIVFHVVSDNERLESLDFDLSSYFDPIYTRVMRTAFSTYDKHRDPAYPIKANDVPTLITIPRFVPATGKELTLSEVLELRNDFDRAAAYAAEITTNIPVVNGNISDIIRDFKQSELFAFQQRLAESREDRHPPFDAGDLPLCIGRIIEDPVPYLRHGMHVRTLVRFFTRQGWSLGQVADLVRSKYEDRTLQWGHNWQKYDPRLHAFTMVRVYGGLMATGLDDLSDFNCAAYARRGICFQENCGQRLESFRPDKN